MRTSCVKYSFLCADQKRLDASYHINDTAEYRSRLAVCPHPITTIGKEASKVFYGNIFSRVYVKDETHGIPYLSASEMQKADLNTEKYLSKKQAEQLQYLMLAKDWILISCSGTLGNCVYTDSRYSKMIGTHDLIRLIPQKDKIYPGVVYAFLASKFGYAMLTHSQYGSVVQHTNSDQVKAIPIPVFPASLQEKVHSLITEAARLREDADVSLKKALSLFDNSTLAYSVSHSNIGCVKKTQLDSFTRRMDAQYQLHKKEIEQVNKKTSYTLKTIKSISEKIFLASRGRRVYSSVGTPFISASDMILFNPHRTSKNISKNTVGLAGMTVHENDILITCDGTIGNTIIVGRDLTGTAVSHHALRLVVNKQEISPLYVFVFLKTQAAMKQLQISAYGSVILSLNPELVGEIKIPILDKSEIEHIVAFAQKYRENLSEAAEKEDTAIRLVEEEIEKWQK